MIRIGAAALLLVTTTASAAPTPPAPPMASCLRMPSDEVEHGDVYVRRIVATPPGQLSYCIAGSAPLVCWRVDLASGTFTPVAPDAQLVADAWDAPAVATPAARPTVARKSKRSLEICVPGQPCRSAPIRVAAATSLAVSDDGAMVATLAPRSKQVETWDAATGKRLARFKVAFRDWEGREGKRSDVFNHDIGFLGHSVIAIAIVCACEGSPGLLYDGRSGRRLGPVASKTPGFFTPLQVDGEVWAFGEESTDPQQPQSGPLVLQDASSGRVIARVEIGEGSYYLSRMNDRLVAVGTTGLAGRIVVLDDSGHVEKRLSAPACP